MIPVNEPVIGDAEVAYVTEALRTGWISSAGRFLDEFERGWAAYCGRRHGIAVANGTVALQAAVRALRLNPGDEIIVPSFTIVSCASAITEERCTPVLVDCDPDTWCMNVSQIESRITPRTRAIMAVHIYGHPVDMNPVLDIARRHDLAVIEDAAEAHGAEYRYKDAWRRCGSFGEMSTFSFYANKLLTTGEGGMIVTDDDDLADRLRRLRNLCFLPGRRFYHDEIGFQFRLTNVQAAIGLGQLERMEAIVASKRRMGERYSSLLKGIKSLQLPVERSWARSVYWMYGVVVDDSCGTAVDVAKRLRKEGVDTRPFFLGMHEQPAFHKMGLFGGESYPVTERIARQGLYLPSGLALTDEQMTETVKAVQKVVGYAQR